MSLERFYLPAPIYDMANATLKRQSQELSQAPTNSHPPTEIARVGLVPPQGRIMGHQLQRDHPSRCRQLCSRQEHVRS